MFKHLTRLDLCNNQTLYLALQLYNFIGRYDVLSYKQLLQLMIACG